MLVSAADGQQRGSASDLIDQLIAKSLELPGDGHLLAILATADEQQVGRRQAPGPDHHPVDLDLDRPRARAPGERRDVAAVAVEAQEVRKEVDDVQAVHTAAADVRTSEGSGTCVAAPLRVRP